MVKIDLIIDEKNWLNFLTKKEVKYIAKRALDIVISVLKINIAKNVLIETSIILTNDKVIKNYNNDYRNIDKSTNVLSFPIYEKEVIKELNQNGNYVLLGDIILSIDTIIRESNEQKKQFSDHLTHLVVHSILHLFGFDHINEIEAKYMESIEIKVLKIFGINNPYL